MNECKRIITPNSICTESALDAVCKLVATGMKVASACKFVAEEYQKNYPEDKAEWNTLKQQYYRSNPTKAKTKKQIHVSKSEEKIDTCIYFSPYPLVHIELYTKAKEHIKELEERIKNLEYSNELLNAELLKSMGIEAPPQKSVVKEVILLTRPEVDAAIAHYGNDIQKGVLKDNKKNAEVFRIFCGVRSRYLENNPPISLPIRLREAVGCVDDSENNTDHIPKKILRA